MQITKAIDLRDVKKRFAMTQGYRDILTPWRRRYVNALNGVSLNVPTGSVFGILGPNGAGKTTLLKILSGLVTPDEGEVFVNGTDVGRHPEKAKEHLMYVSGEERTLYWRLTARQNLEFFAVLSEVPKKKIRSRVDELISVVGLEEKADEMVVKYSSGMRQKLAIARGLIMDPSILLLDEPTRSLDPLSAQQLWTFIREELVGRQQKTVVLATHNMEEATHLCDEVAILHGGEVKVQESPGALLARMQVKSPYTIGVSNSSESVIRDFGRMKGVRLLNVIQPNGPTAFSMELELEDPEVHLPIIIENLVRSGAKVSGVAQTKATLGDVMADIVNEA